ncbi:type II secretion system F family protein [Paenibacillus koleovorans]|uniref:type II secretion system F family protein n=1 Tax=Paenibacillus koleovorans TaxID=121608 RepID=UPI000FDA9081|nr:type II secretion system F family protein [Paenibacillus koleovorans]
MVLLISCFVGLIVYIVFLFILSLLEGNRGSRGHIKRYFDHIRGKEKKRVTIVNKLLRLSPDQQQYAFDAKKYFYYSLPACLAIFLFMTFMLRTWEISLVIGLVGLYYPRLIILSRINKRRKQLNMQLKDAMYSLSTSLKAGSSLQKAIERSVADLQRIFYRDKDAPIVLEFKKMSEDLNMGYTIEEALTAFRDRVQLEDVNDFVNATLIAKNRGGNLTEIFTNITRVISDKIEIKNEINILTAGKKMESKILSFMPIGIVACLTLLSPDYMEPMYSTFLGKVLMIVGFIFIVLNYFISRKIVNIEV